MSELAIELKIEGQTWFFAQKYAAANQRPVYW